jgi:tRNA(fMet)-specific endonuclease VapC
MSRKRFLLGTNIVSDLVRNPSGRIAIKIRDSGEENTAVSIITSAELRY